MLALLIAESARKPPMIMSLNDFRSERGVVPGRSDGSDRPDGSMSVEVYWTDREQQWHDRSLACASGRFSDDAR
jgi:hypothetical protein